MGSSKGKGHSYYFFLPSALVRADVLTRVFYPCRHPAFKAGRTWIGRQ